jgi:membrane protein implicated in regulation of membrane protease activity
MMQGITDYLWAVWLVIAALFAVVEVFTVTFIALWFGIGAAGAALVAAFGLGFHFQLLTFAGISTLLTVSTRRIFQRWLEHSTPALPAPGDISLIGKRGVVVTESRGPRSEAELELDGTVWTALPLGGDHLKPGEECEVVRIEGNQLYVRPLSPLPDWRGARQPQRQ